jgi:hypothetical protein
MRNVQDAGWDDPGRQDRIGRLEPREILHGNDGRRSQNLGLASEPGFSLKNGLGCGIFSYRKILIST